MQREHLDEFVDLQETALLRLREASDRRDYIQTVQALVLPSFDDNRSYELMLPRREGNSALGVRKSWKRPVDAEKFRTPVVRLSHGVGVRLQPTIEEGEGTVPVEQVSDLLSRATALAVAPYIPNSGIGLDGTSYELVLGRGFTHARFRWWCDAPAGWETLAVLLQEIATLVESAIALQLR